MTAADRAILKRAVDRRTRELVRAEWEAFGRAGCGGCGGELEQVTDGCRQCRDRARRQWSREHRPGFRARESALSNARRQRRRRAP